MTVYTYVRRWGPTPVAELDAHYTQMFLADQAAMADDQRGLVIDLDDQFTARDQLLAQIYAGDWLIVARLADLAVTVNGLAEVIDRILARGAALFVWGGGTDSLQLRPDRDVITVISLLNHVAAADRSYERARTLWGMIAARPRGRGRPAGSRKLSDAQLAELSAMLGGGVPVAEVADKAGVSVSTVRRYLMADGRRRTSP